METRTVNSLPLAAYHDGAVRCLLAIELSKKSWIVAVNTPLSDKVGRHTLRAGDWKGLLDLIARIRTRAVEALNRPVEVISCYEAGYDGFWLHRLLEAHGVRNYVIDPASLQVDRRARRVKTDNIDLGRLLRSLMAYLRSEPKVWSIVRVPSDEDDRRLHRERDRLINERVQHVNRIKGLCAVHGIYDYEPLRPNRLARLGQLRAADGCELPPRFKAEIMRELQRLELVLNMIKTIEAERDAIVSTGKSSTHANAKKIQDLIRLKSVGPEIGTTLVGEVFYRHFNNRQQLGSYVGLTPSHFQSGPSSRDQGISKAGNPKGAVADVVEIWMTLSPAFSGYRVMRQRQAVVDPN